MSSGRTSCSRMSWMYSVTSVTPKTPIGTLIQKM